MCTRCDRAQVFDYINASEMKQLAVHGREVSAMVYVAVDKAMLSSSWDRSLLLSDESTPDKGVVLKCMKASAAKAYAVSYWY